MSDEKRVKQSDELWYTQQGLNRDSILIRSTEYYRKYTEASYIPLA